MRTGQQQYFAYVALESNSRLLTRSISAGVPSSPCDDCQGNVSFPRPGLLLLPCERTEYVREVPRRNSVVYFPDRSVLADRDALGQQSKTPDTPTARGQIGYQTSDSDLNGIIKLP